jgi:hypothetical protein
MLAQFSGSMPFLWLLLTGGVAGCAHHPARGPTLVQGVVVTSPGQKPVAEAVVHVYQASPGGGYTPVGPAYPADATGRFCFSFPRAGRRGSYLLRASAPPGYVTEWGLAPSLRTGHPNTSLVLPLRAPAWVRLQLVDELPRSRVSLFISGYEGSGDRLYYPRDTVLVRPSVAGFAGRIIWVITDEQGRRQQQEQAIRLGALDTARVRITF